MTPKRVAPLKKSIRNIITNGLATRFRVLPRVVRKYLLVDVEQWGRLRRLEGGDIMHAHGIVRERMDGRDASFIRVRDPIIECF